jgi:hypothetical protein
MNSFGDYMLVRRLSGEAICELPKREPIVVFNKNLKDLVENTVWIKHYVYSTFLLGTRCHQRKQSGCGDCDLVSSSMHKRYISLAASLTQYYALDQLLRAGDYMF